MTIPTYIGLNKARQVLAEMGVDLNDRQIKLSYPPKIGH